MWWVSIAFYAQKQEDIPMLLFNVSIMFVCLFLSGKVGDWKNHFTVAQNEAMDALIEEKLKGTGLKFN